MSLGVTLGVKRLLTFSLLVVLVNGGMAGGTRADQPVPSDEAVIVEPPSIGLLDNFFLKAGVGAERTGDSSEGFGVVGVNWGIPLTPPEGIAVGLQLGGNTLFEEDEISGSATVGAFTRHVPTYQDQHGAAAVLFDYYRTESSEDLWAVRPIIGTTISRRDALGLEAVASLNKQGRQRVANSLTTFWNRGWSERFGTEFGVGYEIKRVDASIFRVRAAMKVSPKVDLWCGADVNSGANFVVGIGLTYRCTDGRVHATLTNIGGDGRDLHVPFPTKDFAAFYRKTKGFR